MEVDIPVPQLSSGNMPNCERPRTEADLDNSCASFGERRSMLNIHEHMRIQGMLGHSVNLGWITRNGHDVVCSNHRKNTFWR